MSNTLNYRGDVTEGLIESRWPLGPDMFGAWYAPITATYDPEKNITSANFVSGTYVDMLNYLDGKV